METSSGWLPLVDAARRAEGLVTYFVLYHLVLQNRIESRRVGKGWQVRQSALDRYLGELRTNK